MSADEKNNDHQTLESILSRPDTRNEWIKFQLAIRDTGFADIARELGISRATVRSAMVKSYPKMERAIAAKIGMAPEVIWPERYQKNSDSATGRTVIRRRR
jgi:Ner family transcriptional regulator